MASLEHALACSGGFAVGKSYVINHQRLSGSGYCFSASLPPLCAVASVRAITALEESPHLFSKLQTNVQLVRDLFIKWVHPSLASLCCPMSPTSCAHTVFLV